jgi:hypothetical protein
MNTKNQNQSREIIWTIKNHQIKNHFVINWIRSSFDLKHEHRLVFLLKHQSKNKSMHLTVIIVKNLNISLAIAKFRKNSIRIALYERSRRTYQMMTIKTNREKNNFCNNRCRDRWNENNENWCLQLRKQFFRW